MSRHEPTIIDAQDAATARETLSVVPGTDVQAYNADLAAIAGLTSAADKLIYYTGSETAALADLSSFGRSLIDDSDAETARGTLGLGTISTQASDSVSITGGSISGITDLAIADGGTGASTAQAAIDALTQVSGATNEYVLTKDTASGNAIWKVAAGGGISIGDAIGSSTGNRVLICDGSNQLAESAVTDTELGYVSGVTSSIQTQLGTKLANLSEDTTPQLGGNLDLNTHVIKDESTGGVSVKLQRDSSLTNYYHDVAEIKHETSGSPTSGFGVGLAVNAETYLGSIVCSWTGTSPSYAYPRFSFFIDGSGGTKERHRFGHDGSVVHNVQKEAAGDFIVYGDTLSDLFVVNAGTEKVGIGIADPDELLHVDGNVKISDAGNIVLDTTTGTKIGTSTSQKLAFFNATPVVQQATISDPTGGGTVDAEARSAINDLIDRFQAFGLIA